MITALKDARDSSGNRLAADAWLAFAETWSSETYKKRPVRERAAVTVERLLDGADPSVVGGSGAPPPSGDDTPFYDAVARLLEIHPDDGGTAWLSAELTNLFALGDVHPMHPGRGDHVVLIATDNERSEKAAMIVGRILALHVGGPLLERRAGEGRGDPDSPDSPSADEMRTGGVTVATIEGLSPGGTDIFTRSSAGLADVLASAYVAARDGAKQLVLHPIGGLKGTIPLLTSLVAHLPTGAGVDATMWYTNERTLTGMRLPLLRMGVPDEEFWDLQTIAASGSEPLSASDLRTVRWNEYAWRSDGDTIVLTDLGIGILSMRDLIKRYEVE